MYKLRITIATAILFLIPLVFANGNTCFGCISLYGDSSRSEIIRIAFYNTENLFDTEDDPKTRDESFTPEGDHHWTYTRYKRKLDHIGRCLALVGGDNPPAIIGLSEIENRKVLNDLINTVWLKNVHYRIIHKDSPDHRGIDVGFLYDPAVFVPLHYEMIGIDTSEYHIYTREMIYVEGKLLASTIIHLFVVHWPSRRGGQIASEKRRMLVAGMLRKKVKSILAGDSLANILIMGDFNDNPGDESLRKVLRAIPAQKINQDKVLINLMFPLAARNEGSYCHQHNFPEWDNLDQIIVTGNIYNDRSGIEAIGNRAYIFRKSWLMDQNGVRPFSTFLGPRYLGGFSDHLPVYIDLELTGKNIQ